MLLVLLGNELAELLILSSWKWNSAYKTFFFFLILQYMTKTKLKRVTVYINCKMIEWRAIHFQSL